MAELLRMTSEEFVELDRCESVIRQGLETTGEVIQALKVIKDRKLYRQDYRSFESYCTTKWGFGANYAGKLMAAGDVAEVVPVHNERQAREIKTLSDEEKVEAWERASEEAGGEDKITAKILGEAARKLKREQNKYDGPDPAPMKELVKMLVQARKKLEEIAAEVCGSYVTQEDIKDLDMAIRVIRTKIPAGTCPSCKGKGCGDCDSLGWVSVLRKTAIEDATAGKEPFID